MKIDIVQELTGRFVKITMEAGSGNFGAEMLKYNDVEGLIGARIHNVDSEPRFMYPVGNMISVSELFEKRVFTSQELLSLISQVIDILSRSADYFLEGKNLLLRSDYMFYDEDKKQLKVIYLDGLDSDVADGISKLLENFMDRMNHRDKELVFLVYGMHRISRDSHFNLKKLSDFIAERRQAEISQEQTMQKQIIKRQPEREQIPEKGKSSQQKDASGAEADGRGKQMKSKGKCILFLIAGIFLTAVVIKSGLLVKPVTGELDTKKAVVFVIALVAAEGYLLGKERTENQGKEKNPGRNRDIDRVTDIDKTVVLHAVDPDETVVLEKQGHTMWHLNLVPDDWQREEIKVRNSPFFIGKNPVKSDGIIEDGEISRLHAKIVIEEEGVFLIDQDSTNGTFLNEKQLVPWERCKIKNGDMIGLSSIYYRAELYQ